MDAYNFHSIFSVEPVTRTSVHALTSGVWTQFRDASKSHVPGMDPAALKAAQAANTRELKRKAAKKNEKRKEKREAEKQSDSGRAGGKAHLDDTCHSIISN